MLRNPTVRMHECNACGTRVPYGHGRSARGDGAAFDQRGYHALVVEHSRARFLRAEYLGAVAGAYGALEGMIRAKSGVDGHGTHLINRALGEDGALEVGLPGLAGATRASMRRGLAQMCVGAVSGMRNPIAHDASLRIGRGEALDMLGVLSYLCGQVEQTRRRAGQGRPSPAGRDARARTFRPKAGPAGGGRPGQVRGAHGDRAREAGPIPLGAVTRGAVCASGHGDPVWIESLSAANATHAFGHSRRPAGCPPRFPNCSVRAAPKDNPAFGMRGNGSQPWEKKAAARGASRAPA